MSYAETVYLLLVLAGILSAIKVIGTKHIFDISSPAAWFLLMILITHFSLPAIFFINKDWVEWNLYALPPFEQIGIKYGLFIFLAICSFGLGYGPTRRMDYYVRLNRGKFPQRVKNSIFAVLLVITLLSYICALKYRPVPGWGQGVEMVRAYSGSGMYLDTTGYLVNAVQMVPGCGYLCYAATGSGLKTLLLTAPWFLLQVYFGWGRAHVLLFLVGLLGIIGLKSKFFQGRRHHLVLISLGLLILLPIVAALGNNRALFRQALGTDEMVYQIRKGQARWFSSTGSELSSFNNSAFYFYHSGKTFPHAYCFPYLYTMFVQPIPRILWKTKPLPQEMDTQVGAPVGMAPGIFGDAFHQLGWFGVLIFLFHGWWIKRAAIWLANLDRPSFLAGFGFLLTYPIFIPSPIWLPQLAFFLPPALMVYLVEWKYLAPLPWKKNKYRSNDKYGSGRGMTVIKKT